MASKRKLKQISKFEVFQHRPLYLDIGGVYVGPMCTNSLKLQMLRKIQSY